jgi:hypothetical protein
MPPGPHMNAVRATRLGLAAASLAALSAAAFAVTIHGISDQRNPSLADVSSAAVCAALFGAPVSLILSILAMKARGRCLNPRPKAPLVALSVSIPLVVGAVCLVYVLLVLAAFDHPGS